LKKRCHHHSTDSVAASLFLPFSHCLAKQQRVTDLQQIVGIVSKASALKTNGKQFLFVRPHSASSWTSARQTLHPAKSVATSCVGFALSSMIDSSVLGLICFACMWKRRLCPQARQTPLSELTRSCGLDVDCSSIAILSLAHMEQFLVAKVLNRLVGCPCQMMMQVD